MLQKLLLERQEIMSDESGDCRNTDATGEKEKEKDIFALPKVPFFEQRNILSGPFVSRKAVEINTFNDAVLADNYGDGNNNGDLNFQREQTAKLILANIVKMFPDQRVNFA